MAMEVVLQPYSIQTIFCRVQSEINDSAQSQQKTTLDQKVLLPPYAFQV